MRTLPVKTTMFLSGIMLSMFLSQCNMFQEVVANETVQSIINNSEKIITQQTTAEDVDIPGTLTDPVEPQLTESILFAWYPFNGNANDETGNGHNATVEGPVLTTDRFGAQRSAYLFDGENDYIICSNVKDFPAGKTPRSVAGWFKSTNSGPYIMMLFGLGSTKDRYNFQVGIGPGTSGTQYRVNGWGDSYDWRTGVKAPELLDGIWHHCAVTYDGAITKVYFDGALRNQTADFTYIADPETMVLVIGREIDLDEWEWNGALDDVAIYTGVLSAGEIDEMAADTYR
jgi:hypothetical protein